MNPVRPGAMAALIALSPILPSVLPSNSGAASAATFPPVPQAILSAPYKNATDGDPPVTDTAANISAGSGGLVNFLSRVRNNRINNLSMGVLHANLYMKNDLASFKVYAPMETENRALSVAKTIPNSPLDDVMATWVQTLLLASRRQIHAEFAYSVRMGSRSNIDSAIIYRMNPGAGTTRPTASLRYSTRF